MPNALLAPLPPVVLNALIVSTYLSRLLNLSYLSVVLYIGLGEVIACYGLGYPLLLWLSRRSRLKDLLDGE
jgi:uncharacterized membrane protein